LRRNLLKADQLDHQLGRGSVGAVHPNRPSMTRKEDSAVGCGLDRSAGAPADRPRTCATPTSMRQAWLRHEAGDHHLHSPCVCSTSRSATALGSQGPRSLGPGLARCWWTAPPTRGTTAAAGGSFPAFRPKQRDAARLGRGREAGGAARLPAAVTVVPLAESSGCSRSPWGRGRRAGATA
jgi:hypothetical protein